MAQFIIRVELHNANSDDYEILHDAMFQLDFFKVIKDDNTGIYYSLPTAEYNYVGDIEDINQLIDRVNIGASQTGKEYQILVTKSKGIVFYGLEDIGT